MRAPLHAMWTSMVSRCHDEHHASFAGYGARGIAVCLRWRESFEAFIEDLPDRPSPKHSLDRIDNNGNYEPSNVRWATWTEQARNKRTNHMVTIGDRTLTISGWAEVTGVSRYVIAGRLRDGWPPEAAVSMPSGSRRPGKKDAAGASLVSPKSRFSRSSPRSCPAEEAHPPVQ